MLVRSIDAAPYVRPPRLGVDTGLSLAKMILKVVPDDPTPGVLMAATMLAASVGALETTWSTHGKPKPPRGDTRTADRRLDRDWGAVQARLATWSVFPDTDPKRRTAEALTERLFPTGLDFLKLPYLAEHAQSERRLQIIEAEDLRDDLDALVGEDFMEELLAAHEAYGDALGITKSPQAEVDEELLVGPLRALGEAIVAYALQIVAYSMLDEQNVPKARRALEPIDRFRAAAGRRASAGVGRASESPQDEGEELEVPEAAGTPEGARAPEAPMPALLDG